MSMCTRLLFNFFEVSALNCRTQFQHVLVTEVLLQDRAKLEGRSMIEILLNPRKLIHGLGDLHHIT